MPTNDGDAVQRSRLEWKLIPGVLQQHNALFRDVPGVVPASERIDNTTHGRIVDDARGKHAAQNAAIHVVETVYRDLSIGNSSLQRRTKEVVSWHLLIEAGVRSLDGTVCRLPIGNDPALETKVFFEHLIQQVIVFTSVLTVQQVKRTHNSGRLGHLDCNLEGQQVSFAHGALIHADIDNGPAGLLIVQSIVLDIAHDVLRLNPKRESPNHIACENRIFTGILEVASVPRFALQIDATTNRHIETLGTQFPSNELAIKMSRRSVPRRRQSKYRWQKRGIAAFGCGPADAHGRVGHIDVRDAEPLDSRHITNPAIRLHWHVRAIS